MKNTQCSKGGKVNVSAQFANAITVDIIRYMYTYTCIYIYIYIVNSLISISVA